MSASTHELLAPENLAVSEVYRLMIDLVAPRPIAWVSTQDEQGRRNLAPFSYFQAVCSRPPTIVLGLAHHADGRPKDTLRNVLALGELTVSHVGEPLVPAMNRTSGDYAPDVDEWTIAGDADAPLASAPSTKVRPPWVAQARAALECRLQHAIPLGEPGRPPSSTLVVAHVVAFHVARDLVQRDEHGRLRSLDHAGLRAVGRMGGMTYTRTRDTFDLARPKVDPGAGRA